VTVDFNHPLAGQPFTFVVEILKVSDVSGVNTARDQD
jgi:FKBP-type peptidyl-prolyl cis-trans isomerase 2